MPEAEGGKSAPTDGILVVARGQADGVRESEAKGLDRLAGTGGADHLPQGPGQRRRGADPSQEAQRKGMGRLRIETK